MPDDRTTRCTPAEMLDAMERDAERIVELVAWARSRIAQCRRDEEKFFGGRTAGKYARGDSGICAAQERRTLQAVLSILGREP